MSCTPYHSLGFWRKDSDWSLRQKKPCLELTCHVIVLSTRFNILNRVLPQASQVRLTVGPLG